MSISLPEDISIDETDGPALRSDAALWRLYDSSFPSSEREPADVIRRTVEKDAGFVLRARTAEETIGMAFAHLMRDPAATFLVYLAIDARWQSRHIGAALFERTASVGARCLRDRQLSATGIVFEIDDAAQAVSPEERAHRLRRRAFFERAGARPLAGRYVQPAVDGRAPVPMQLMFRPEPGVAWPDAPQIARLVRAMYFEKYQQMNGIPHEALQRLLVT
jgi:hypothetical protein